MLSDSVAQLRVRIDSHERVPLGATARRPPSGSAAASPVLAGDVLDRVARLLIQYALAIDQNGSPVV